VAALLGCFSLTGPVKDALHIIGAAIELLGIIVVASPDLLPGALRFSRWIRLSWRRLETRIRRVLHISPRVIVYDDHRVGTVELAGHLGHQVHRRPKRR
jgi:hypothetical protein